MVAVAEAARDRAALVASVLGPLVVAVVLVPFRNSFQNTNGALVLVLVVVAVAANGYRRAGILAAVSASVWYDFFLTRPYEHLTITGGQDVRTTVLLLLVGFAVTELAVWGRREHAAASRAAGYEAGIRDAARSVAADASASTVVPRVSEQLTQMFHLRSCRFDYGSGVLGGAHPRLTADGTVTVDGRVYDVDRVGLPLDQEIELIVMAGAEYRGRFLMSATRESRPPLAQRLVAVALASQAARLLATSPHVRG